MSSDRFVADGRERLLNDPAVRAELAAVSAEIEARYAPLLQRASFLERFFLRHRMEAELRRAVERLAPSDALYVVDPAAPELRHAVASPQPAAPAPLDVRSAPK